MGIFSNDEDEWCLFMEGVKPRGPEFTVIDATDNRWITENDKIYCGACKYELKEDESPQPACPNCNSQMDGAIKYIRNW